MSSSSVTTFPSIGAFYASDRRRRMSRERDLGLWWRGSGHRGPTFRAAWVAETGELYLMQHEGVSGGGRVDVVGVYPTFAEAERGLAGWDDVCGEPGSLRWLLDRLGRLDRLRAVPAHLMRAGGAAARPAATA